MKRLIIICLLTLAIPPDLFSQESLNSLTEKLNEIQDLGYLPGFAVSIVSAEGVHYQEGFGYSDTLSKKPFTVHSLQNIGSISKTLTGIALAKLVEDGKLSWDTPINNLLPYKIYNPYYPKAPITVAHLATHTATINDPFDYERTYLFSEKITLTKKEIPKDYRKLIPLYNENVSMPVETFVENMVHPLGKWYKKKNFLRKKPGTTYQYSNMGAAIAGMIIERAAGTTFQDYTRKLILDPLQMTASGWSHDAVDMSQFVSLYLSNNQKIPNYELISYADGGMITNVHDLSLFFSEMIRGYQGKSTKILKTESFTKMMNEAFVSDEKTSGLFWAINGRGEIGHSGGDPGIMAFMMFNPETGIGRITLTNKFDDEGNGINQLVYIWKTLEEYIPKITSKHW